MRECAYRKGCWQYAYGDDRWCYWHQKKREPPEKSGTERDLWTSEALAIKEAGYMLLAAKIALGHRGAQTQAGGQGSHRRGAHP